MRQKNIDHGYRDTYRQLYLEILNSFQKSYFDEAALPSYTHSNRLMSYLFWKRIENALQMANPTPNSSILDFGCGGAVTFKWLNERGCKIAGCENQFFEMSKKVCEFLEINACLYDDVFKINNRFDTIFALDVLEHVDELDKYLHKLKALLADKGQFVVSGPTENYLYKIGRSLAGFSGHYHVRNIYDIEKAMVSAGFQRVRLKSLYPVVPLFRLSLWRIAA